MGKKKANRKKKNVQRDPRPYSIPVTFENRGRDKENNKSIFDFNFSKIKLQNMKKFGGTSEPWKI